MPFLETGEAQLYFETHGTGRSLVFLHGRGGNTLSWWQQVDAFAARYRCILLDQRGWGRSRGPLPEPWVEAFVPDLAAVLDHLGVDRFAVVAQSMGGWTVAAFGETYPERIVAAVMSGTTGGYFPAAARALVEQAWEESNRMAERWQRGEGPHPAVGARMYAEQPALARLYAMITGLNPPKPHRSRSQLVERPALRVPGQTLFITGEEDPMLPSAVVDAVAAELPGSRVHHLPRCGHSPYFERAAAFNAVVLAFLDEIGY